MLPTKMRAQVFYNKENLQLEYLQVPKPAPDQALIRVHCCGICGTDTGFYCGRGIVGTPDGKGPLILGHEFAGEIVALGSITEHFGLFHIGDHVMVNPVQNCGVCPDCRKGLTNMCRNSRTCGVSVDGAFAEYVVVSYRNLLAIPKGITFEDAALCEPLACALHGIKKLNIHFGDSVVIFGPGTIGQMMVKLARSKGAGKIVVVGLPDYGLRKALEAGADYVYNIMDPDSPFYSENLSSEVATLTNGAMADCAITPTSAPSVQKDALTVTGGGARIVFFGMPGEGTILPIPVMDMFRAEKSISFSLMAPDTWDEAASLIGNGLIAAKDYVSHYYPLEKLEEGMKLLLDPQIEDKTKVMIRI